MGDLTEKLKALASTDIFKNGKDLETFVGHPFYFDYETVKVLVNDKWKHKVGGVPAGSFLLCSYGAEPNVEEMVLVRVIGPTQLPTDSDVIASMVDYYKEGQTSGPESPKKLDSFTRYEFMFSGIECRVLGTYYRQDGKTKFGADVENFYSAHNYSVYKPAGKVLEYIVELPRRGRDSGRAGPGAAGGGAVQRVTTDGPGGGGADLRVGARLRRQAHGAVRHDENRQVEHGEEDPGVGEVTVGHRREDRRAAAHAGGADHLRHQRRVREPEPAGRGDRDLRDVREGDDQVLAAGEARASR